jgi:DNA-binding MarR family transcriptional regulator
MNFYQELGPVVFGTRLKRMSDIFLSEVNKVYADNDIPFEASWFGIFYLLDKHQELSIFEIAETLEVSHSAVSQLVKVLLAKQLIDQKASIYDGRKKVISLSASGLDLLIKIKPVWLALSKTMEEIMADIPILEEILQLENKFATENLSKLINKKLHV